MKKFLRILRHPLGITLIILFVIGGGLVGARYVAWPFYKEFRERRWITMAEQFHTREDLRSAGMILRKVVDANPGSYAGWEMILKIAKEERSPGLPQIYAQFAQLRPDDEELHYEWAASAIQNGNFEAARTALDTIGARDTDIYHRLAATIAIGTEDFETAENHFLRLLEMNPADQHIALNLAIIRLHMADDERGDLAREKLAELAASENGLSIAAVRALLTNAVGADRRDDALRQAEILQNHERKSFSDRLSVLDVIDRYQPENYETYLQPILLDAEQGVIQARAVAQSLNRHGRRGILRTWIETLPQEFKDDQRINLEYIEALLFLEDLPALEARLRTLPWEQDDFYRHAMLAQTLRQQNRDREFRETWQRALIAAQENVRDQRILYLQAANWGWEAERIELADRIFQRNPREQWAFVELFGHHQNNRNTPELTRLFARQVEVNSSDTNARNNLAYLWLLQGTNLSRAHSLARQIFSEDSSNPRFRTTYAFSLYRQGRYVESLRVFEDMPDEHRTHADRALHYGLILGANENWSRAAAVLEKGRERSLFPEEDRLMGELRTRVFANL